LGADNTLWALTCEKADNGEYKIIKWNHFTKQWYLVPKQTGIAIAAYNEVSCAVISNDQIYVSSSPQLAATNYIAGANVTGTSLFSETIFLTQANRNYIASIIPQQFKNARLLWRQSRDG